MQLTNEQLSALRKPFEAVGAFEGCSEGEIKKLLEEIVELYSTQIKINLRIKREQQTYGK